MLSATTTAVQANTSGVSRYTLASCSCLPMDMAGRQMTSAAIPDFHANPSPVVAAARKYGITEGIRTRTRVFHQPSRYTFAISSSPASVSRIPFSTLPQTTGTTIRKAINAGSVLVRIQTKARMINEATGAARTILSSGDSSTSAARNRTVSTASSDPAASAAANPTATRSSEPPAACQNRASPASCPSVRAT